MLVLVCGSRGYTDKDMVWQLLGLSLGICIITEKQMEIIQGGAIGPDSFAREWAEEYMVPCTTLYPDWNKFGRRAGIIRNDQMLDKNPNLVLAFWDGKSPGTHHTIDEARRRGIRVEVIRGSS